MALPSLLQDVRTRPTLHLHSVEYDAATALLHGFDLAHNRCFLMGFREWLVARLGYGNNLWWTALALYCIFPNTDDPRARLVSEEAHKHAVVALFDLLDEFTEERTERGIRKVLSDYENWLQRQDWYDSDPSGLT